ncbi:MAG: DNA polymerase III subunit delta [Clostridia bacterium]|nr:DNA polymerase III subunit delta [Clostridia bacterium]
MPEITETDLRNRIKSSPCGAYLIYGSDNYFVRYYTGKLIDAAVGKDFRDFNLHVFDGDSADLSEIYDTCVAVPMMAESKCVLVKDYNDDEEDDFPAEAIEMILKDNPEDNCLIFSFYASDPSKKMLNSLSKLFKKYGQVIKFEKKTTAELVKSAEKMAQKNGKSFGRGVAEYFVNCVGDDLNLLINEISKLFAYSGEVIERKDVDAVCTRSLNFKVFDMVGDIVNGRFDSGFHRLSQLFEKREDEHMILGALISQYADLYRIKATKASGNSLKDLTDAYPSLSARMWSLQKSQRNAEKMSFEQLKESLEILSRADKAIKNTAGDKRQILEQALVNLAKAGR